MASKVKRKKVYKYKRCKIWIAVSPICEGANIYMPGHCHDFFESKEDALECWEPEEVVEAIITYKKVEEL